MLAGVGHGGSAGTFQALERRPLLTIRRGLVAGALIPSGNMVSMDESARSSVVRVAVHPGGGRLARRGGALLFVPEFVQRERRRDVDELFTRFDHSGLVAAGETDLPRCVAAWSNTTGHVEVDSSLQLWAQYDTSDDVQSAFITLERWIANRSDRLDEPLVVVSGFEIDALGSPTDLRDGDVHAGAFALVFGGAAPTVALTSPESSRRPADVTAEPPQFDELTDLDVTLAPIGPVSYPDDDTDRTFRRPGDIRCPRGHANANTNQLCRVCGDALDSTASRPGPRASTALAGLRLPDGSVIPINRAIAVGRSPSAEGARLEGTPRLVAIDAPSTVSRTHVVLRVDGGDITITDCDARGRTAVVHAGDPAPIALTPWEPRTLAIGDTVQLGGPTTLTITDPAELQVPASLERTAPPPEREETT